MTIFCIECWMFLNSRSIWPFPGIKVYFILGNKRSFNGKRAQGKREVLDTFRAAEVNKFIFLPPFDQYYPPMHMIPSTEGR